VHRAAAAAAAGTTSGSHTSASMLVQQIATFSGENPVKCAALYAREGPGRASGAAPLASAGTTAGPVLWY
jgi:hypothetical protein